MGRPALRWVGKSRQFIPLAAGHVACCLVVQDHDDERVGVVRRIDSQQPTSPDIKTPSARDGREDDGVRRFTGGGCQAQQEELRAPSSSQQADVASSSQDSVPPYHSPLHPQVLPEYSTPIEEVSRSTENLRQTGKDPRKLRVFNLSTGVLDELSFDDAYGVHNLYRDYKNIDDIDEVESKLGQLVEHPSVELIQSIHADAAGGRDIVVSREKLERLRKFIFIMFFRQVGVSHHFFDAVARRGGGSATALDMWLRALAYIIDTLHNDLIKQGFECMPGFGDARADPAKSCKLTAPGREFVLTDNNMGLFEGLANFLSPSFGRLSLPETLPQGLHRLFVISPTMTFVLRLNDNIINTMARERQVLINGDLDKIPKILPVSKTVGDMPLDKNIHQYRAGPGQKDKFTFTITTLTPEQTDQVNFVLLREVKKNGFLSFKDTKLCGELLTRYWKATYFVDMGERPKLRPLYSQLVPKETRASLSVQTSLSVPELSGNRSTPSSSIEV
ncbi:hypothetical protein F5887DRAFT_1290445 [Amanita rubescens]|nr:hypothetical protein F5887DRAFT_1290445 [Amanita rubescens]